MKHKVNPSKGACLIEPATIGSTYSPYLKIELRKFRLNLSDLKRDTIRVGFSNSTWSLTESTWISSSLNQSIYLMDYNYTFTYLLESTATFNRSQQQQQQQVDSTALYYELKWEVELLEFEKLSEHSRNLSIRDFVNCTFFNESLSNVCEGIVICNVMNANCSFALDFKRKMPSMREIYGLRIGLHTIEPFTFETRTLSTIVRNDSRVAYLFLKTNLFSKVGFSKYSLFNLNDRFRLYAELKVERSGQLNSSLELIYTARQFSNKQTWLGK